ncbi:MAG: hypothetical protein H8D42_01900 [Candidatus Marinimicrobia bacterium]|nr:hypothetical protein [Candidatus Neomarinimicrobiota bacterium]MBL7067326.1 hypothetical protein [Candidatus Neomarinimicrobiota bacterium]
MENIYWLIIIIAAIGIGSLVGVFVKMKPGFGPFNLRIIGIIIVATFVSLLALYDIKSISAAMGILGAIVGYLFGIDKKDKEQ